MTGILGYCNSSTMDIIRIVFPLILLLASLFCPAISKSDRLDREDASVVKAKAFSASVIYYTFCAAAILTPTVYLIFDGKDWNWMHIMTCTFFIMMGIDDICTGAVFCRLAKRHDNDWPDA